MEDALCCLDQIILVDRVKDAINLVSTEKLARIALSYDLGFLNCKEEKDARLDERKSKLLMNSDSSRS